ncbi:hypothetical protein EDB81DRAFT_782227 [Dactylonectria macrodidyma]|uniref:Fungal N-terminal domain-containing protein n=1 Tax=Dactylonectria macrodidyma TaxID=307937 RepID=A0A9P9JGJ0_9HYPO|nr:hypothetical protein EDB81DRAFT_782227 [Dactylonectria macrodidyma]
MAEALGAVASVLQLADVTIRSSLCLYTFFASLQSAQHDFQQFLIVIRNVHDAVQMLRAAVRDQPLNAIQEEAMRRHLDRINGELASFNKTIDGKDPTKLTTRVKWVLHSANTDRALQRLENDKTSLLLLIQALNLEKSGRILRSQNMTEASISTLQSNIEEQHSHERALHSQFSKRMKDFHSEMELSQAMYHSSLRDGFSSLSREIEVSGENMGNTLRYALEQHFRPMLEEALTNSEMRNEARIEEFRAVMNSATTQIMEHMNRNERPTDSQGEHESKESRPRKRIRPNDQSLGRYLDVQFSGHEKDEDESQNGSMTLPHIQRSRRPIKVTELSYWTRIPWIGTFRIEFSTHSEPRRWFYTFKIEFWPCSKLLRVNTISLKYSSRPDRQGYVALSPSLAFYPIIEIADPIWDMIYHDDLFGVMTRFRERRNGPLDQNSFGISLLWYAAYCGSFKVIPLLIDQGANPSQATVLGFDALDALIIWAGYGAVIGCQGPCLTCNGYDELSLPGIFATAKSFISHGCDFENCQIRIYTILREPLLTKAYLNRKLHQQLGDSQSLYDGNGYMELGPDCGSDTSQGNLLIQDDETYDRISDTYFNTDSIEHSMFDEARYLTSIRQLAEFLNCHGLNFIQPLEVDELYDSMMRLERMNLRILQACGLNSNFEDPFSDHMKPILFQALGSFETYLKDSVMDYEVGRPTHQERVVFAMDNLVELIASGADIYHVEWANEDWANHVEDGLMTPTVFAERRDMLPEWLKAVAKAGYDPDEVLLEDIRRRREFRLLHGAKSSSVEVGGVLRESGSQEVRRRKVGRAETV